MRSFLFFAATVLCAASAHAQTHAPLPAVKHKQVVIAHRGDHVSYPENTLEAYKSAILQGVDYIETDLRTTKDSGQVIMHSESVDGMTSGKGQISELSYDYVHNLNITDAVHHKKYKVPCLKEVLLLCRDKVNIYLDFKAADVNVTWRMIVAFHMENHVVVYANTLDQFKEWRRIAPAMPLIMSVPENVKDVTALKAFLDEYPVSAVDGAIGQYSPEMLALLKSRNVAVWLDVQDQNEGPATWSQALSEGVPGMQTDHPAALTHYLTQQHAR